MPLIIGLGGKDDFEWKDPLGLGGKPEALESAQASSPETQQPDASDWNDIVNTVIAEAGGDGPEGMAAVANVIRNRSLESGKSPADIVRAPHQFTGYAAPGPEARKAQQDPSMRATAEEVLRKVFSGQADDPTGGARFFHTPAVNPTWDDGMQHTASIGGHEFYRPRSAAEAAAREAREPADANTLDSDALAFLTPRIVGHGPEAVEGMKPVFRDRLAALFQSAPPAIQKGLGIFSGFRSPEHQSELWQRALKKYGSAAAARKWVAPPPGVAGSKGSRHNFGVAADLSFNGKSLAHAPKAVVDWVHQNAGRFGLTFPLSNENWHIETVEARGGKAPQTIARGPAVKVDADFKAHDPMGLYRGEENPFAALAPDPVQQPERAAAAAREADIPRTDAVQQMWDQLNAQDPGRYMVIDESDFADWKKQWEDKQPTQLMKGLKGALVNQNPELLGNALDALGQITGVESFGKWGDALRSWSKEGSFKNLPKVGSVSDIRHDSIGNFVSDTTDYAAYLLGSSLGSMAPGLAAGTAVGAATANPVVGFIAGAAGPAYVQNLGDVYGELRDNEAIQARVKSGELSEKQLAGWAATAAVPMAALDTFGLGKAAGALGAEVKQGIVRRVVKGIAEGAITEGGTEGLQQVINEGVQDALGGDKPLSQQVISVIDNAIGGMLGGGVVGGASHVRGPRGGTAPAEDAPAPAAPRRKGPLADALEHGQRRAAEAAGVPFTVNDPAIGDSPAGAFDGQTVTAAPDQSGVPDGMRRVLLPDGRQTLMGERLLTPQADIPGEQLAASQARQEAEKGGRAGKAGTSGADSADTPEGAPARGTTVRVDAPGIPPFMATVDTYADGEVVLADSSTGEVIQVPLDVVTPIAPPPGQMDVAHADDVTSDDLVAPSEPIAAESKATLPPQDEQKPALERFPGPPEPGKRVIVDAPGIDRFAARIESYEDGATEALVKRDDGTELQVPVDALYVSKLTRKEVEAQEAKENPPVEREKSADPAARDVGGKQMVMPDEKHARLFDLGKARRDSKRLLGAGQLDMDSVMPAEQRRLAAEFKVTPQDLGQMADDYRYRVERAAKQARSAAPQKMYAVNEKRLRQWQAAAAKAERPADTTDAAQVDLDTAAHDAATSPQNGVSEPSEAQKEAGNYRMGHVRLGGLDLSIENPQGSERRGTDRDGKEWSVTMKSHYGYIRGTVGRDKDHIDAFVRPGTKLLKADSPVYVVDQVDPTGKFDEHKVMLGFASEAAARKAYQENYAKGWKGLGTISPTTLRDFKSWLESGNTRERFGSEPQAEQAQEPTPAPASKAPEFDSIWKDKEFRPLRAGKPWSPDGSSGVHRESEVAADLVKGFRDGKGGTINPAEIGPLRKENIQNGFDPVNAYGVAAYYAATGKLENIRVSNTGFYFDEDGNPTDPGATAPAAASPAQEPEPAPAPAKAETRQKKPKDKESAKARIVRKIIDAAPGDVITPSIDVGYSPGGEPHEVISISRDGSVYVRDPKTDARTSWSFGEVLGARKRGVTFEKAQAESAPAPAEPVADNKFSGNKIFTADKVEAARARLKSKLGQLNSGIDPEVLIDGMTIAGAYIEAGLRDFSAYAKQMRTDFGDRITPYLLSFWEGARNYPGLDTAGMTSVEESARLFADIGKVLPAEEAPALGSEMKKPAKTKKKGRPEDRTLTQDWGVEHIDAYTDEGEQVKEAFLKEATGFLRAVGDQLTAAGFGPVHDRKNRPMKPVHRNDAGPAVSGEASLHMVDPETGNFVYAQISGTSLRGMVPTSQSGISIMFRASDREYGTSGINRWAPTTLTAGELAAMMRKEARGTTTAADLARQPAENPDGPSELDRPGPRALEGAPSEAVSRATGSRDTGEEPAAGGQADLFGGEPARGSRVQPRRGVAADAGAVSPSAGRDERTEAGGVSDARDAGRGAAGPEVDAHLKQDIAESAATPAAERAVDYAITEADAIGQGGAKTKFRNNLAAIRVLRDLDAQHRPATRDEQSVLAKWVGWGGLSAAFPREDGSVAKGWEKEAAELRELLTDEEYQAAASSTRNAHYTSPEVVNAIWRIAQRLGYAGGMVLEPSVGAGNFVGMMPAGLRKGSHVTGVELDRITGGIAKNLYPDANIQAPMGFQNLTVPDGYFDLAIGNPPFGSEKIYDPDRRHLNKFSIHNFFFAKSIDALKPNGVLAMVVTNYFLDANRSAAREYIAARADLLGAIRLPNNAFLANAGTEVTTDIIVLRKRPSDEGEKINTGWTGVGEYRDTDGNTVPLNRYFLDNPEMMLGDFGAYGTMYGREKHAALVARDGDDLPTLLQAAINRLPEGVMDPPGAPVVVETVTVPENVEDAIVGSAFLAPDGTVHVRQPDLVGNPRSTPVTFPSEKALARVSGLIRLRDTFARLRRAQIDENASDDKIEELRAKLNKYYDAFVKANGPVNLDANRRLFRDDPTWPQVSALEEGFDRGVSRTVAKNTGETPRAPSARKAAIFSRRTQQPYRRPTTASSAKDALASVLSDRGRVDLAEMSRLYGKGPEEIVRELGPLLFRTPAGAYETADAYLSGNVKAKLAEARRAAETDSDFRRNVAALEDVIPADIEAVDIDVKPGAPWLPPRHMAAFADHITGETGSRATYSRANAKWVIDPSRAGAAAETQWGTDRAPVARVLDAVANGQTITIYDKDSEGKSHVNPAATEAANEKAERVKAEWRRWLWTDDARREELVRIYNDTFNTDVLRAFDGSHLTFPGKVGDDVIELRPHQKNFVWRAMQSGTALADHVVGAGKTFAVVASVMEMRRTGQARKPMVVVPNHLVGQWGADFVKLYPGAKILAATKKDFEAENRKRLFARVASGDWDAVIVAHSSFGRIGVDPAFEQRFIEEQIADIEASEAELRADDGKKSRNVKQLAKQRENLETKLKQLLDAGAKDVGMTFDEMGIDALVVDEAHEFKNLGFATSMTRVAGLGNTTGSRKAADLYMKVRSVLERTGGRNIIFATGTPLSNTMAEMFTLQRYLDGQALRDLGVSHFDAWARVFGEVVTDWELSPSGQYKLNSRFAKFVNMPELMQRYLSFADVITNDDIKRMLAEQGKTLPLPRVKGGKPENVVVERSTDQAAYIGEPVGHDQAGNPIFPEGSLVYRAEHLPKKAEKGSDNMLKVMSDARKAALDMRLIDPAYPDVPGSKAHVAADQMKRIRDRWNDKRGTQLVFIDLSTPKKARGREEARIRDLIQRAEGGDEAAQKVLDEMSPDEFTALDSSFSVYDDLKQKLIDRGIPAAEIAFIHDANTDLQKEELFGKVRSGQIRLLFGSTAKMGAGTNVQNRLVALHHLDAPWRPSDLEQRDGRGIRQGNELYAEDPDGFEIEILRYATKNTLDARQWQTIEGKARFIQQMRKGGMKVREIEDIAGEAANAAEMKAAASGNPLILEEMDLRQKLRKLESAGIEHDREQHRIRDRLRRFDEQESYIEKQMPVAEADAETARAVAGGEFKATIGGAVVDKVKDAGAAIIAAGRGMLESGAEQSALGSIGGFKLRMEHDHGKAFTLLVNGASEHTVHISDIDEADPVGAGMRVLNTIRKLPDEPENLRERLAEIRKQRPAMERQIGPWADKALFEETQARHRDVIAALKPKTSTPATPTDQAEGVKRSIADEPVVSLTGDELGVNFGGPEDMPALRRAAQRWYNENLMGSTIQTSNGIDVHFNRRGQRKTTYGGKGDVLLRAVAAIPAIIKYGKVVSRELGNREGVIERIVLAAPVEFMGSVRYFAVSLHQTTDGHWHYDFTFDRDRDVAATGGARQSSRAIPSEEGTGSLDATPSKPGSPGVSGPGGPAAKLSRRPAATGSTGLAADGAAPQSAPVAVPGSEGLAPQERQLPSFEVPQFASGSINLVEMVPTDKEATTDGLSAAGLTAELKRGPLGRFAGALLDGGKVRIVPASSVGAATQGFTEADGTIHLVADRIAPGKATAVLLHEAFHAGTQPLMRRSTWNRMMFRLDGLFRQFEESSGAARRFFDAARARVERAERIAGQMPRAMQVEEFGAYAVEEYESAPRALRRWVDDLVGTVKAWVLRRFGRQVGSMTPAQLRALAISGLRDMARGRDTDTPRPSRRRESIAAGPATQRAVVTENRVIEEVKGRLTDLQPHVLAAVPFNYFSELKRPNMIAVDDYLKVKRQMDAYRGKKHAAMDEIAQEWLKYVRLGKDKATALATLMHDATLAGIDPAATDEETASKPGWDDYRHRFMALPGAGRELYVRVRDAYKAQAAELDRILLDNVRKAQEIAQRRAEARYKKELERIAQAGLSKQARKDAEEDAANAYNVERTKSQWSAKARMTKLRQAFENSRVAEPYFPLTRFGRYFVSVRDVDGTVMSFSRREKAADRDRLAADMRKAYPTAKVETGVMEESADLRAAMDPRLVAEIEEILGGADVDVAIMDQIWQRYLETMPDLSSRKRFIHRKGTAGFQEDALRSFAHHMFHAAHQMGRLKYGLELQELTNLATDQAREADDPTRGMTLANELKKRHKWVMNPMGSSIAQVATSSAFVWYLGTTPAAAIVNLSQTPMLGIPILGARFGGVTKAATALTKAAAETVMAKGSIVNAKLKPDERRMIEAAYESGLIDRTQAHDIAGVGETGVEYSPVRARVMAVISWMFHRTEVANREVTALAAYRMARAAGQDESTAIDSAHDLCWKVNFDYSNSSRPRLTQNDFVKVALVFRAYNINMIYRIMRDFHQTFRGETPQVRREARYQLAGVMGMMSLMAGTTGVFGFHVIMAIAGMLLGDDDDPFDFETRFRQNVVDILGPELGGVVLNGVPGHYLGIDLTSRIGMPDIWFRSPYRDLQGEDEYNYWVLNSLGAIVSMGGDLYRGIDLVTDGKVARGAEVVAPKFVRDLMKSWRYMEEGVTSLRGDQLVDPSQIDAWDVIAQATGFTPAKVAETYERNSALKTAESRILRERRELINRFALAVRLGDAEARGRSLSDIKRWNTKPLHRPLAITPDSLQRSIAARRRNSRKRQDGVLIQNRRLGRDLRKNLPERIY